MFSTIPITPIEPIWMSAPQHVKVLLLDDNKFDCERIRRMSLKADIKINLDEVGTIEEMVHAILSERYDVILLDYMLPVGSGLEALNHINNDPRNCYAAKIMITGTGELEAEVQALHGGCHDYLTKDDLDARTLSRSMVHALIFSQNQYHNEFMTMRQNEMISLAITAALQDGSIQNSLAPLIRSQIEEYLRVDSISNIRRLSREFDGLLTEDDLQNRINNLLVGIID